MKVLFSIFSTLVCLVLGDLQFTTVQLPPETTFQTIRTGVGSNGPYLVLIDTVGLENLTRITTYFEKYAYFTTQTIAISKRGAGIAVFGDFLYFAGGLGPGSLIINDLDSYSIRTASLATHDITPQQVANTALLISAECLIFAGGLVNVASNQKSDSIDFACISNLQTQTLSVARDHITPFFMGNFIIFAGGIASNNSILSVLDIFYWNFNSPSSIVPIYLPIPFERWSGLTWNNLGAYFINQNGSLFFWNSREWSSFVITNQSTSNCQMAVTENLVFMHQNNNTFIFDIHTNTTSIAKIPLSSLYLTWGPNFVAFLNQTTIVFVTNNYGFPSFTPQGLDLLPINPTPPFLILWISVGFILLIAIILIIVIVLLILKKQKIKKSTTTDYDITDVTEKVNTLRRLGVNKPSLSTLPHPTPKTTTFAKPTHSTYETDIGSLSSSKNYMPIESKHNLRLNLNQKLKRTVLGLSEFENLIEIGRGEHGIVYKAKWDSQIVAIKMIPEGNHFDIKENVMQEFEFMNHMGSHPHVLRSFGIIVTPLAIVTEYMSMGSLHDMLHSNMKITDKDCYSLALGIAQGLAHLHKSGIVHRDLAARNILLDDNLVPKIADFGFARDLGKREWAVTTAEFGPVKIMAPESILFRVYSTKSDVWSFGLLLVEIYSRQNIYDKVPFLEVINQVCHLKNTYPIPGNSPPLMAKLMQLCWKFEPSERPDMGVICHLLDVMNPNSLQK